MSSVSRFLTSPPCLYYAMSNGIVRQYVVGGSELRVDRYQLEKHDARLLTRRQRRALVALTHPDGIRAWRFGARCPPQIGDSEAAVLRKIRQKRP